MIGTVPFLQIGKASKISSMGEQFTFRRMQASDKDDMIRISSKIWDGHDFLPSKFDDWVKDEKGYFLAVLHDGKLIGSGKITFATDTDVLFEGLRKDQDIDIKGVGYAITRQLIDILRGKKGLTSIRFVTYFKNYQSISVGEKLGFKIHKTFSLKDIPSYDESGKIILKQKDSYAPVQQITDVDRIMAYVYKSDIFSLSNNLLCLNWVIVPYSDDMFIEKLIKPGKCFAIIHDGEIKALAAIWLERGFHMSFFDAENFSYAKSLITEMISMSFAMGKWSVEIFIPDGWNLKPWFDDLGFRSWEEEHDVRIYEYPIDW